MMKKFNAKPDVDFKGPVEKWTDNIADVILLNIMEMNYLTFQEYKDLKIREINLYGHRKDLNLVKLERFIHTGLGHIEGITNIKKKIVPDSIADKILIEVLFESRDVEWVDGKDYNKKIETIKEITIQSELKVENNHHRL